MNGLCVVCKKKLLNEMTESMLKMICWTTVYNERGYVE